MSNNLILEKFTSKKDIITLDFDGLINLVAKESSEVRKEDFYKPDKLGECLVGMSKISHIEDTFKDQRFLAFMTKDAKFLDAFKEVEMEDYTVEILFSDGDSDKNVMIMNPKKEYESISSLKPIIHQEGDVVDLQLYKVEKDDIVMDVEDGKVIGVKLKEAVRQSSTDIFLRAWVNGVDEKGKMREVNFVGTGKLSDKSFDYHKEMLPAGLMYMGLMNTTNKKGTEQWETYIIPHNGGEEFSVMTGAVIYCGRPKK